MTARDRVVYPVSVLVVVGRKKKQVKPMDGEFLPRTVVYKMRRHVSGGYSID